MPLGKNESVRVKLSKSLNSFKEIRETQNEKSRLSIRQDV